MFTEVIALGQIGAGPRTDTLIASCENVQGGRLPALGGIKIGRRCDPNQIFTSGRCCVLYVITWPIIFIRDGRKVSKRHGRAHQAAKIPEHSYAPAPASQ